MYTYMLCSKINQIDFINRICKWTNFSIPYPKLNIATSIVTSLNQPGYYYNYYYVCLMRVRHVGLNTSILKSELQNLLTLAFHSFDHLIIFHLIINHITKAIIVQIRVKNVLKVKNCTTSTLNTFGLTCYNHKRKRKQI